MTGMLNNMDQERWREINREHYWLSAEWDKQLDAERAQNAMRQATLDSAIRLGRVRTNATSPPDLVAIMTRQHAPCGGILNPLLGD